MLLHFKQFEEMEVWQDARRLTSHAQFTHDFSLRDQIQESAVSVMSNISEGYERESRKDFILHLRYAKGSVGELRCQLYVAVDLGYMTEVMHLQISTPAISVSRQLSQFILY